MTEELYALDVWGQRILAVNPDTGSTRDVVTGLDQIPDGIAVDEKNGWIYWTNMGQDWWAVNGSLEKVRIDGTDRQTVLPSGSFTTGKQLRFEPHSNKLYWCDREGLKIWRANTDGSELELLVQTGKGEENKEIPRHPVGIVLDVDKGLLYWTQKGDPKGGNGRIFRAGIEIPAGQSPDNRQDIELLWENLPEPIDLEIDFATNYLYWTDRGAEPEGNTLNRAHIPAAGVPGEKHEILYGGLNEGIGLAFNPDKSRVFVTDLGGHIYSSKPDGSDKNALVSLEGKAVFTGIEYIVSNR